MQYIMRKGLNNNKYWLSKPFEWFLRKSKLKKVTNIVMGVFFI